MDSTLGFTIDDVFEIALAMEEDGAAFYAAAATRTPDPLAKKFFTSLVRAEGRHHELFQAMRENARLDRSLAAPFDPGATISGFLRGWTRGRVFSGEDPAAFAQRLETRALVEKAISLEQEAIDFYLELRELLPDGSETRWLDKIVGQEREHRRGLERVLARIAAA